MKTKSMLPALLLIVALPALACQMLQPAPKSCRVDMPTAGWTSYPNGEQVSFQVDEMRWTARVDCAAGQLVDGEPARPARARQILIPVENTTYKLFTADPEVSMAERHENGSHVRIDADGAYYLVYLSADPAAFGDASVSYFMGGQAGEDLVHLYCYDRTPGKEHTSVPAIAAVWTVEKPVTVSFVCSGRDFVLEVTTEITSAMLSQGPTPVPATPAPTITPEPPGSDL